MEKKEKTSRNSWTVDKVYASAMGVTLEEYLEVKVQESELIYEFDLAEFENKIFERLYYNKKLGDLFIYEVHFASDLSLNENSKASKVLATSITLVEASNWFMGVNVNTIYKKRSPKIAEISKKEMFKWILEMNEWIDEQDEIENKRDKIAFKLSNLFISRINQKKVDEINEICDVWKNEMSEMSGVELEYDKQYVKLLDKFIEEIRLEPYSESYEDNLILIGFSLGRCFISEYGGIWLEKDQDEYTDTCVLISNTTTIYPFTKVYKQFNNGSEDSIYAMFVLFTGFFDMID